MYISLICESFKHSREIFHSRETPTKRQETQHDCLPSLLGDEDKGIVYGDEKYVLCRDD
jgi:hypothetical protein